MKNRLGAALIAAGLMLFALTGTAFGHHVISLSGTVDCDGDYSVHVTANVFGSTHLITALNGIVIGNEQPGGSNANHSYTYNGTDGHAGEGITAYVSDSPNNVMSASLVLTQETCEPEPTPTPEVTPTPTPPTEPTPTPPVRPTDTPRPHITLPPTATSVEVPTIISPDITKIVFGLLVLIGAVAVALYLFRRGSRP